MEMCWFDKISDNVLLHLFTFLPRSSWRHIRKVCARFQNVCNDKELFRNSNLAYAYGMSDLDLQEYISGGSIFIKKLNLNHCYWFSSTTLVTCISKCQQISELFLLECRLTTVGFSRIMGSIHCLKTLVLTISDLNEFLSEIHKNSVLQSSLRNLEHFAMQIGNSLSLNSRKTIIEYCPNLVSFCVIGQWRFLQKSQNHLFDRYEYMLCNQNLKSLKTLELINSNVDTLSRAYFFGIFQKALAQRPMMLENLSLSVLDQTAYNVCTSCWWQTVKQSWTTLRNLDLSRVIIQNVEELINDDVASQLQYLNVSYTQSDRGCISFMTMASRCPNLVSLNLKGATFGQTNWQQVELDGLDEVLHSCPNLQHLNISGVHVHRHPQRGSLVDVLTRNNISGLKSLAISLCSLVAKCPDVSVCPDVEKDTSRKNVLGKRARISKEHDSDQNLNAELSRLHTACPDIISLELIEAGFSQSDIVKKVRKPQDLTWFVNIYTPVQPVV